jgi:chromatin remodeling complex protein RSC6
MSSSKSTSNVNAKMVKKTASPTAPAPVVAVSAPAPEVAAPAPTPRVRKAAAVAASPAPVPAAPAAETTSAAPVVAEARTAQQILAELQEHLKALSTETSARVRTLVGEATEVVKALKRDARLSKHRRRVDPETLTPEERVKYDARRANNAFLKLRPISDELASFMGLPAKSQKSQTDVTKFVSAYVKSHSCFDSAEGASKRTIIPDAKLAKLLRPKDGEEVTYLNLQKFLKGHFLKAETVATA